MPNSAVHSLLTLAPSDMSPNRNLMVHMLCHSAVVQFIGCICDV